MKDKFGILAVALESLVTATQTNEIFQIIQLAITVLTGIITIAYTIFKWYRNAKSDGKITVEEVRELADEITQDIIDQHGDGDDFK